MYEFVIRSLFLLFSGMTQKKSRSSKRWSIVQKNSV